MDVQAWRKCSSCKQPIPFRTKYWTCDVSTCNRNNTNFVFCSMLCWDSHLPVYRHRSASAHEHMSPAKDEWEQQRPQTPVAKAPSPMPVKSPSPAAAPKPAVWSSSKEVELLVVASKVKAYIRQRSGMNTSESVMKLLTRIVRTQCDRAIQSAESSGRKTVTDRDVSIRR